MTQALRAALYARFSTEEQSAESITDQFRVCARHAEQAHFVEVARFSDAAISGGTAQRPGYQALLAAARCKEFDVIVAEDLKRLWRELAEQWRSIKELLDLGLHIVTVSGIDTRQPNFEVIASVIGAAAELDRKETGYRTRRGLEGLAAKGAPTGGKAYGYEPVLLPSGEKSRRIVPERAQTVRWIFEQYAAGWSPRRIAAELNARGVPSPGADWRRNERRRDGKWLDSTINNGILDNPLYAGEVVWNRVRWVRSAADSKRRRPVLNPESEWIRHQFEDLRVVPAELWERVRQRRATRTAETTPIECKHVRRGRKAYATRAGKCAKYPLSGLLRCGECGASYSMVDGRYYGCSSNTHGGAAACPNDRRVKRVVIEEQVIGTLRTALLTPERVAQFRRGLESGGAARERARAAADVARQKRLAETERTVAKPSRCH